MAHNKVTKKVRDEVFGSIGNLPDWEEYLPAIVFTRRLVARNKRQNHARRIDPVHRMKPKASCAILGRKYFSNIQ